MRPLLFTVVAVCLVLTNALPENIEDVKELPQTNEPVVEAAESSPQARKERCSTCSGILKLNGKSPKDVLAAIQALPGGEVHTQQSFEGCSSDKGCAGIKVKDGRVVEKFGNLDSFNAAAAQNTGNEFSYHAAGSFDNSIFDGALKGGPFWWMNQNSPFKNTGAGGSFEKFSKSSSSTFTSNGNGALGGSELGANPFLNGDFSKLAGGFGSSGSGSSSSSSFSSSGASTSGQEAHPSTYQTSSFESSSFKEVDVGSNPFLNGGAKFGSSGFGSQFGGSKFGASGSGFTGSTPGPFTASTGGSNVNLVQNTQKQSEFDYEQQSQTNIDEAFQNTGNVLAPEHSGGGLQQTCAGQGYICVHKAQCNNGVVNTNGGNLLQARTQKQYCNTNTEICCRIEVSGAGSQGSLGVGSATFSSQGQGNLFQSGSSSSFGAGQGSSSFNSGSKQESGFANSFGASGSANRGTAFGSTVAPTANKYGGFNNEVYKSTSQSSFVETDSFSAGSQNSGVYRPGASGSGLKPGIPYLPPIDNTNSGSNVVTSAAYPSTFVTTPRPFNSPRPFTTPKPTYVPSTSAPGYLPPVGESSNNRETILPPNPSYPEGSLILDETRQPTFRPPVPTRGPSPNDIPAGCAAALKCTPIEFCTAEGVISNTTVVLTREQDAYRVPLTDCKDLGTGRIGKCCRDPLYTDPWPSTQLGKWVPGVFGGNDGKYVPDSRPSPTNNQRPQVTVRPPITGSVVLNNFRTEKPTVPTFGPNQITPGYPSSTVAPTYVQKTQSQGQFGQGQITTVGQGQAGFAGQGQLGVIGIGQGSKGSQGQFAQGSQFSTSTSSFGQSGSRGQGQVVTQGQGLGVTQGNGASVSQGAGFGVSQGAGFGVSQGAGFGVTQGAGFGVSQERGQTVTQGQGLSVTQGQGAGVTQGQGQITSQGQGFGVSQGAGQISTQGQGFGVSQGAGQISTQGQGFGISQGVGQTVSRGQGFAVSQGSGQTVSQGVGQVGFGVNQGQGSFAQGGRGQLGVGQVGFTQQGQSVSQGQGQAFGQGLGVITGQGSVTSQGQTTQGLGVIRGQGAQGQGFGVTRGQGQAVSQGQGFGVSQGAGQATQFGQGSQGQIGQGFEVSRGQTVSQTTSQSVSQGFGQSASQGVGQGVSQGQGFGVIRGSGQAGSQGNGFGVSQGSGLGVSQGFGQGLSQGSGQTVSQGFGQSTTQGFGQGVTQGQGQAVSQGFGQGASQGFGQGAIQGFGQGVSQGSGQSGSQGFGQSVSQGFGQGVSQGFGQGVSQGSGQSGSQGFGQSVSQGFGQGVSQGFGQGATQGSGQSVSQGFGLGVSQGFGQSVSQSSGQGVSQGFGQEIGQGFGGIRGQGQGLTSSQGVFGQGQIISGGGGSLSFGTGQAITQGQGQALIQGEGQVSQGGIASGIRRGQGYTVAQGAGFGVENEYSESVQRVFLKQYSAGGQCGLLNPQKPYGNRNDLEVEFAEIPWQAMVLLQTNRSLLCGGVITRPDVVITSAACVDGLEAKNVLIKGGEWKLGIDDEPLPFQIVQVKTILRHPYYKRGSLKYDAAILVLSENLRFAKNIYPICLPGASETLDAFYNGAGECIVTGWGKQVLQAHLQGSIMHSLNVSLTNPGECEAKLTSDYPHLLEQYDQESCVCGQPTNPINNICKVDIGSALACTTGDGHFTLRGVYSWDSGCQVGNQIAAFYKFDLEWYEWAIGLIESVRFAQFTKGAKVTQNRYTTGIINSEIKSNFAGVKGGIQGVKTSGSKFGFGEGQVSGQYNQFGKFEQTNGNLNFGSEVSSPISNTFSATYSEKKVFQSEPKYVTYTTKPEIVTFTTKPEYFTYTTKPKIVTYTTKPEIISYTTKPKIVTYTTKPEIFSYTTKPKIVSYTTKPQIITYETSGSGTNPQYVAPEVTFNPSFSDLVAKDHKHNNQCKCLEGKK